MGMGLLQKNYTDNTYMQNFISLEQIDSVAQTIRKQISIQPIVGIILGSGLNGLADSVQNAVYIPHGDLPNFPISTVHGHAGRFVLGACEANPGFVKIPEACRFETHSILYPKKPDPYS